MYRWIAVFVLAAAAMSACGKSEVTGESSATSRPESPKISGEAGCTVVSGDGDWFIGRTADFSEFVALAFGQTGTPTQVWSHASDGNCRGMGPDGDGGAWLVEDMGDSLALRHIGPSTDQSVTLQPSREADLPGEAFVGSSGRLVFLFGDTPAGPGIWQVDTDTGATQVLEGRTGDEIDRALRKPLMGGSGELAVFGSVDSNGQTPLVDVLTGETYVTVSGQVFDAWGTTDQFVAAWGPAAGEFEGYVLVNDSGQRNVSEPCGVSGGNLRGLLSIGDVVCYRTSGSGYPSGTVYLEQVIDR